MNLRLTLRPVAEPALPLRDGSSCVMPCHVVIPVSDVSQIGEARRAAQRSAEVEQLNETDAGRVAVIATELATNLVRHSKGGGEILIAAHGHGPAEAGVEV